MLNEISDGRTIDMPAQKTCRGGQLDQEHLAIGGRPEGFDASQLHEGKEQPGHDQRRKYLRRSREADR